MLKNITTSFMFLVPSMDDLIDSLSSAKYYMNIYLKNGCDDIIIIERNKCKTLKMKDKQHGQLDMSTLKMH